MQGDGWLRLDKAKTVAINGLDGYAETKLIERFVYNEVEGWQNYQFWGDGEFALPFGDFEVNITVPADHIVAATGTLFQNFL